MSIALKDSPAGWDPSQYATAYDDFEDETFTDAPAASDDDQSFAEDEQL